MIEDLNRFDPLKVAEEIFICVEDPSLRAAKSYVEAGINRAKKIARFFPHQADPEILSVRAGNHPLCVLNDKLPSYPQLPYTDIPLGISLSAEDVCRILDEFEYSFGDFKKAHYDTSIREIMMARFEVDKKSLHSLYDNYIDAGGVDFMGKNTLARRLLQNFRSFMSNPRMTSIVGNLRQITKKSEHSST